jgi:hypothetical protein
MKFAMLGEDLGRFANLDTNQPGCYHAGEMLTIRKRSLLAFGAQFPFLGGHFRFLNLNPNLNPNLNLNLEMQEGGLRLGLRLRIRGGANK